MSQTTTLAVIGGAAALASAVLGLVHHDAAPAPSPLHPPAAVVLHLEHPLYVPTRPDGVLGPTSVAPLAVAPYAVIRPL
jgi:hypothetical protein